MNQLQPFIAPAIFHIGGLTHDRGLRFRGETQELSDEQKVVMMKYHDQFGWIMFKPNEIDLSDIPKTDAEATGKTPSTRLRGVLFKIFIESGEKPENFPSYYISKMEEIITHFKAKIAGAQW